MRRYVLASLILALVVLLAYLVSRTSVYALTSGKGQELVSPYAGGLKIAANLWFPKLNLVSIATDSPKISAQSAYFVEADSGEVLYRKNEHQKMPVASLVKIMAVILTLENRKMSDEIKISQTASDMEPDKMLLIAGESLTVEELLGGVFLISANDAAEALAEGISGDVSEFVNLMNKKATQLGMENTLFANPTGLEESNRQQYSTSYDVAIMSRFVIKNFPEILNISAQPRIYLPQTDTHQDYDMYSGINLITTYPGVIGLKTGFTPEAGFTLVTVAKRDGRTILGVLLNSENRRDEAKVLLDYSLKKLGI